MSKNEVDNFLGDLNESENDPFVPEEDPFAPKETEDKKEEEKAEEVEEKALPFHKDPKVQRYVEKQIAKALESRGSTEKEFVREVGGDEDDYYSRLIGNDTPEKVAMIKEAKARDERLLQSAEERAFSRLTAEQQKSIEADKQAEEELETSLEDIEENFSVDITSNNPVARKTRVDFLKFVERIAPKNSDGDIIEYPDMTSAFETFQETRKAAPQNASRAKDLSARSMSHSSEASQKPQQGYSWKDVDNVLDKLS